MLIIACIIVHLISNALYILDMQSWKVEYQGLSKKGLLISLLIGLVFAWPLPFLREQPVVIFYAVAIDILAQIAVHAFLIATA